MFFLITHDSAIISTGIILTQILDRADAPIFLLLSAIIKLADDNEQLKTAAASSLLSRPQEAPSIAKESVDVGSGTANY